MNGFNFVRNRLPITAVAEQVLRYSTFARAPAVAAQSALIRDCLPGFSADNALTVLDDTVLPRIWLGNAITTPTHLDEWNNVGCVVGGRRRFTLFPPEQLVNLYIGPLDFAPTGAPMSLVSLHEPDFARFPRFREALAAAVSADLGPGDALYIPPLWWHHVESLESFNLLVNYWWHAAAGTAVGADSGFDTLIHAMLNLRSLPPATRAGLEGDVRSLRVRDRAEVTEHIPVPRHGLLGELCGVPMSPGCGLSRSVSRKESDVVFTRIRTRSSPAGACHVGAQMLDVMAVTVQELSLRLPGSRQPSSNCRPEVVEELAGLVPRVGDQRFVLQEVVAEIELATIVSKKIEHGRQVMRRILDPVAAVKALRDVVRRVDTHTSSG